MYSRPVAVLNGCARQAANRPRPLPDPRSITVSVHGLTEADSPYLFSLMSSMMDISVSARNSPYPAVALFPSTSDRAERETSCALSSEAEAAEEKTESKVWRGFAGVGVPEEELEVVDVNEEKEAEARDG